VPVNAGALPESMLESELFGHARGSFTGALAEREGKLAMATGGSLLLDEIESISTRAQVQLLRVLDDGIVEPLGSDKPRRVDIRLLTASNADMEEAVRAGSEGVAGPFAPDLRFDSDRLLSLPATPGRLRDEMERVERAAIEAALREHGGEINAAYRALGISRRALYERLKKYGLKREDFRP